MAIAFDNASTAKGTSGGTGTLTLAFAMGSVSNGALVVFITSDTGSDSITGATYNGVAMTQVKKLQDTSNNSWNYLYLLLNPALGSHNIVVSSSVSAFYYCQATSYSGVNQSGQPDGTTSGFAASGTSITGTITTTADNCWGIAGVRSYVSSVSAGSNFVIRPNSNSIQMGDSNAPKTPAGSISMTANFSNGGNTIVMITLAPVANIVMSVSVGTFTLTGVNVNMNVGYSMSVSVGTFILTGIAVTFRLSGWFNQTKNTSTWTDTTKHTTVWTNQNKNN